MRRAHVDASEPMFGGSRLPLTNPWFVNLARSPRLCPECHATTAWEGTLNPDAAYERCPACGWFQTHLAPPGFKGSRCAPVGGAPRGEVVEFRPRT